LGRNQETVPPYAREILDYFLHNQKAAVDVEDMARWRLLEWMVRHTLEQTDDALRWLAEKGFLIESRTHPRSIFSFNEERAPDAKRFLRTRTARSRP
jgi:hypothetical protein